ncbi:MAG: GntR family transcriptional regulator [Lachnospiraceae bacterium]|nr:GntR family transcriptional regulator [Lachnospiraceae bacterium]
MEYIGMQKKQGSIVEILRDEILSGHIAGGTELTQKELAESLGVSRMPVREALILLEYQGLIDRLPNNHVKVADLTEDCFSHIFRICRQIETDALLSLDSFTELPGKEPDFHNYLHDRIPFSFLSKTLSTMIEIYITFAVNSRFYDTESGSGLLREIRDVLTKGNGAPDRTELENLLDRYFAGLTAAIMKEREQ